MGTATVVAVLVAVVSLLLLQLLELSDTTAVAASSAGPPGASTPPSVGVAPTSDSGVGALVTRQLFDELYPNRNKSFYTYDSFIAAARAFPTFGTQGSHKTRVREIAAFSAHVQQETAGLFYVEEIDQSSNYCDNTSIQYPCAPGQKYFGRGPLQLSWNYNYGAASAKVGANILAQPYLVSQDPILAFKSSFYFWTSGSGTIPSIHEVLIGKWKPSKADQEAGRKPGFGVTIDIINGGLECGKVTPQPQNRVKYFKQFCKQLNVSTGPNLSCATMQPF
ncbi:unnamed protein product [Sphagnum jensenii]|uniref:Glycoside hydrolase family 19 catalytic domain-containing protein n=1 Tax=Sphagnum jensenii TaxID=128206 RepID=A0ABP1C0C7_9BRYO